MPGLSQPDDQVHIVDGKSTFAHLIYWPNVFRSDQALKLHPPPPPFCT
jgi:hypothetical protein